MVNSTFDSFLKTLKNRFLYCDAEHMFDQNATIKEADEEEDDISSEMVTVEPGNLVGEIESRMQ